mmetsp:Transcript_85035/g.214257  ORF Transcript_85035/g.214257 Transcript_85035/m.214257 type:complete len:224 (-) Transcript_85035:286-957(-)
MCAPNSTICSLAWTSSSTLTWPSLFLSATSKSSCINSSFWKRPDSDDLTSDASSLLSPFLSSFVNILFSSSVNSLSGLMKNSDCVSFPSLSESRSVTSDWTSTINTFSLVSGNMRPKNSCLSTNLSPSMSAASNLTFSILRRSSLSFLISWSSPSCASSMLNRSCKYSSMLTLPSWLVSTVSKSRLISSLFSFVDITSANSRISAIETWPSRSLSIMSCNFLS